MFGLEILDVAIGLMFVYLLLSLIVTAANEMFAAWLKRRAWMLRKGIFHLIDDPALATKLFDHPLIRSLEAPTTAVSRAIGLGMSGRGPSYIPSHTFATALADAFAPLDEKGVRRVPEHSPTSNRLAYTLRLFWRESRGDDDEFKRRIEVWFNDAMDRVSGWYRRYTQAISLFWAIVITLGTNSDTLVIGKALWSDDELRQAVVRRAEQYVEEHDGELAAATAVPAAADAVPPPPLPPDQQADIDFQRASAQFDAALRDLHELQLPIGWEMPGEQRDQAAGEADEADEVIDEDARLVPDDPRDDWPGRPITLAALGRWYAALQQHLLGWLITIMAISLGAPFWFDSLNKVISIRSAGRAPEEKPKSPKVVPKPKEPGATEAAIEGEDGTTPQS